MARIETPSESVQPLAGLGWRRLGRNRHSPRREKTLAPIRQRRKYRL